MKKEFFYFLLILILGIFLRFFQLGKNPVSMYWDEVAIALDAYTVNETGRDINNHHWFQAIYGSYGDFKAPIFIWLATISVRFLGMNAFAVRLPIAIFSSLLIVLIYFLVKEMLSFDEELEKKFNLVPILSSFLVAINPWPVHFGRIGLESSLSVFWLFLALYLFLKGVKKNGLYLVFASLSAAIGVYTYYSLRVIVPLLFLFLGLIFIKKIWNKKWWGILAIIIFLVFNFILIKSPYYEQSQQYRLGGDNILNNKKLIEESSKYLETYGLSLWSKIVYHRYIFIAHDFLENYCDHFSFNFLFLHGDSNLRHHSGYFGEFLIIFVPFLVLGLFYLFKNYKTNFFWIIFFVTILSPIPSSLVYETPHASRSIYLFVPLLMIIALGINVFYDFIKNSKFKILALILFVLLIINFSFYYLDYFIDYPKRSSKDWLYSYTEVASYIKNNFQKYSEIEIDGKYMLPNLYVYYQFPHILSELSKEKQNEDEFIIIDKKINPFDYILDEKYFSDYGLANELKPKAKFIAYDDEIIKGYQIEREFNFLNGEPSLILIVENK